MEIEIDQILAVINIIGCREHHQYNLVKRNYPWISHRFCSSVLALVFDAAAEINMPLCMF